MKTTVSLCAVQAEINIKGDLEKPLDATVQFVKKRAQSCL